MDGRGHQLPAQYPYWEHAGHSGHGLEWLIGLLLLALVVAVVTTLIVRWLAGSQARALPLVPAAAGQADDALRVVRLRYARGEIDREQFLQTTSDLGGAEAHPVAEQSPTASTP